jgi:hypothetical protein
MANAWPIIGQSSLSGNMFYYENKVMAGLRRDQTIVYEVIPHYIGSGVVPDYWNMEARCIKECSNSPVDFDVQVPNVMTTHSGLGVNIGYWGLER